MPRVVFTDPEFARVGMMEREPAEKIGACACRVVDLTQIPKARILEYDEVALAIRTGMAIGDILYFYVFPTISEALKYAALAFFRNLSKMPCCPYE